MRLPAQKSLKAVSRRVTQRGVERKEENAWYSLSRPLSTTEQDRKWRAAHKPEAPAKEGVAASPSLAPQACTPFAGASGLYALRWRLRLVALRFNAPGGGRTGQPSQGRK